MPGEAEEGSAAEFGEGEDDGSEGKDDEEKVTPWELEGDGLALGIEMGEATFDALGDGPGSHGGSADAFDAGFGVVEIDDLLHGFPVVELEVILVVENAFVVFFVVVAFAKTKARDGVAAGIENDESVGGSLVAVKVFKGWRGAEGLTNDVFFLVEDSGDAGPFRVRFK